MTFGEVAPGRVANVPPPGVSPFPDIPEFILEGGAVLEHDTGKSFLINSKSMALLSKPR